MIKTGSQNLNIAGIYRDSLNEKDEEIRNIEKHMDQLAIEMENNNSYFANLNKK